MAIIVVLLAYTMVGLMQSAWEDYEEYKELSIKRVYREDCMERNKKSDSIPGEKGVCSCECKFVNGQCECEFG